MLSSRLAEEDTVRKLARPRTAAPPAPAPATDSPPRRPQPFPVADILTAAGTPEGGGQADARYRFLARFGATILSGGVAAAPMALYHYQGELGLVPQEVWFVSYILAHRWTAALPYPSLRRMGRRSGVSVQMLHRYKQSLIEKGYLVTIPRHRPSGGRTSNYYDFSGLFRALETLLIRDRRGSSWSPSADEDAGLEVDDGGDDQDDGAGAPANLSAPVEPPADEALRGRASVPHVDGGAPRALPPSQRRSTPPRSTAVVGGSPLGAPAPVQPEASGRAHLRVIAGSPPAALGAATPEAPPESRSTVSEAKEQAQTPSPRAAVKNELAVDAAETSETTKRPLHNVAPETLEARTTPAIPQALEPPPAQNGDAEQRWRAAKRVLADQVSAAVYRAWIAPLRVSPAPGDPGDLAPSSGGAPPDAPDAADSGPLTLVCASAFHLQQADRRYRRAIEAAAGCPVSFTLEPPA